MLIARIDCTAREDVQFNKGEHKLMATLDPKNTIVEANEGNNILTATARCKG